MFQLVIVNNLFYLSYLVVGVPNVTLFAYAKINHESMVSGFPLANRREARKLGLLRRKRSLSSPHSGREEEAPRTLFVEGATQAPGICPKPNASDWSRWSGMNVFAGNTRHRCSSSWKIRIKNKDAEEFKKNDF